MDAIKIARAAAVRGTRDTTVFEAAIQMAENRAGAVLVTDSEKRLAGIVTERDIALRVVAGDRDPKRTKLSEIMTAPVRTARAASSVDDALDIMVHHRIRHLPIVDEDNKILGVVSLQHALMRRLRDEETSIDTLADFVSAGGPG